MVIALWSAIVDKLGVICSPECNNTSHTCSSSRVEVEVCSVSNTSRWNVYNVVDDDVYYGVRITSYLLFHTPEGE